MGTFIAFSLPPRRRRATIRCSDSQSLYTVRSIAMSADRNLLFAVLALQADCVTREQFIDACTAWAANKTTSIDALMVQKGWLTPEDRADVQRLVERKLKNTAAMCARAWRKSRGEDVRQSLAEVPDSDLRQSLAAGLAFSASTDLVYATVLLKYSSAPTICAITSSSRMPC
jgi:hypothetical protein